METAAGVVAGTGADAALQVQQGQPRAADKAAAKGAAAKSSGSPTKGDTIHTLCTSNGSPYLNFQNRIMCARHQLLLSSGSVLLSRSDLPSELQPAIV